MTDRPILTALACTLLALVVGVSAWLAWPTGRAYSYLNDPRTVYQLTKNPDLAALKAGVRPSAVRYPVTETIGALQAHFGNRAWVYAMPTGSMQESVRLGDRTARKLGFVAALGHYPEARHLTLLAGRDARPNTAEIVLTETAARQLIDPPSALVGQVVILNEDVSPEPLTVVGIVSPSPWRGWQDPDEGGYRRLDPNAPGLDELTTSLIDFQTVPLSVVFNEEPSASDVAWLTAYQRERLPGLDLVPPPGDTAGTALLRARLHDRQVALPTLAAVLVGSGLLSLCTLTLSRLLRRRSLLGVDLALGGRRVHLLGGLLGRTLLPALLGSVLGAALVTRLPDLLPGTVFSPAPREVLLLALLTAPLTLTLLTLLIGLGVLRAPALELLRGSRPGQFVTPLLLGLGLALTLALGGVFSALGVRERLDAQAGRVKSEFGRVLEISSTGNPDSRRGVSSRVTMRRMDAADVAALATHPAVEAVGVGERINGNLTVKGKDIFIGRMVTGDPALLKVLDVRLVEGQSGGCLFSTSLAAEQGLRVGDTVTVPGRQGVTLPCPVTGLYAPPDPLKIFVMADYPEVIVPSQTGLLPQQGPLPGQEGTVPEFTGGPLKTTTLLLRLNQDPTPQVTGQLQAVLQAREPGLVFQLRPYTPSIDRLLASLRTQSQLFLTLAAVAGAVNVLGLLGGFLAYLDATRFRIALDRAQGLTLGQLTRRWARGGLTLGAAATLGALLLATRLTPPLYNAFSLDAPTTLENSLLPSAVPTLPGPLTLLLGAGALTLGRRWLARQSLTDLLKAGS
ncbi:ABC transporter permease [Deinococcus radiotolerans]|uniref:MacB-like periplasmic core domain-containing protein n=1 Tax=Deinococcus radiotolerans TaxID=1309407 RepID=A0ABQ2FRK9_9DEIO|nr:ABC transporter permease [Deinococcus radiotolerans]GGL20053.1 hypothetical protein GCM10010844_43710 [Deinococcus radiotolerans]